MLDVDDPRQDVGPSRPDRTRGPRRPRVAVVGAGITGLATAYRLERSRPDAEVIVFEAAASVGGKARTTVRDGYTVDWGPNGFLATVPETLTLVHDLGLDDALQPAADAARRRYLYRGGGLRPLPANPAAFLASEVVPLHGRLRAALEVVLASRGTGEESVHAFLARHFGRSFADALGAALVSGITAGDPRELSVDALFPRLRAMEREHRSLLRALVAQQRAARRARVTGRAGVTGAGGTAAPARGPGGPSGRLTSFRAGGMQHLLDALQAALRTEVRLGTPVAGLEPVAGGSGYRLRLAGPASPLGSGTGTAATSGAGSESFDAVVLTTPAPATAVLLRPHLPAAADALAAIPYAGVRVLGLGFHRLDVPRELDGFGFLVPRGQGVRSLGVLWTSSLYPDRAPPGRVLLRVLAGGRLDPAMLALDDDEALALARRDLSLTMGIAAEPEFVATVRWPQAIAQYTLGHAARMAALEQALAALPGVHLAGDAYRGVGVNDCVREAERVAAALAGSLGTP